jgi:hypothetical protein
MGTLLARGCKLRVSVPATKKVKQGARESPFPSTCFFLLDAGSGGSFPCAPLRFLVFLLFSVSKGECADGFPDASSEALQCDGFGLAAGAAAHPDCGPRSGEPHV